MTRSWNKNLDGLMSRITIKSFNPNFQYHLIIGALLNLWGFLFTFFVKPFGHGIMNGKKASLKSIFYGLCFILAAPIDAHPTGDMIAVGNHVLWSYINPVDDLEHHACIMIWEQGKRPKVLLQSAFPASDYMLYSKEETVYIIERRFIAAKDIFECRIFKMKIGGPPIEIWTWFKDEWRVGEGGFFMPADDQIVFAKYPSVYCMDKGEKPIMHHFESSVPINGLRAVGNDEFLLIGENSCSLLDKKGNILKNWKNLLEEEVHKPPLNRNRVFDIAYQNGALLLAYWGKRAFISISNKGIRKTLIQKEAPLVPHWVCFQGSNKLLFFSELLFDGSAPKPNLLLYQPNEELVGIWRGEL
jgi:hypothetical protein